MIMIKKVDEYNKGIMSRLSYAASNAQLQFCFDETNVYILFEVVSCCLC